MEAVSITYPLMLEAFLPQDQVKDNTESDSGNAFLRT
jgi:hypothetical protein